MTNTTTQGFGWPVSFSVNPEKTGIVIYDEDLNPIKLMDMSPEDFGCISDEEILMLKKENLPESISSGYYVRYKLMQLKKRFLEIPKKLQDLGWEYDSNNHPRLLTEDDEDCSICKEVKAKEIKKWEDTH